MSDLVKTAEKLVEGLVEAVGMMTDVVNDMLLMMREGGHELKKGAEYLGGKLDHLFKRAKYDFNPPSYEGAEVAMQEKGKYAYHYYCMKMYQRELTCAESKDSNLVEIYNDLKEKKSQGLEMENVGDIVRGVKEGQLNAAIKERDSYTKGWGTMWDKKNKKVEKLRAALLKADRKRSKGAENQYGETNLGSLYTFGLSMPADKMLEVLERKMATRQTNIDQLRKNRDSHEMLMNLIIEEIDDKIEKQKNRKKTAQQRVNKKNALIKKMNDTFDGEDDLKANPGSLATRNEYVVEKAEAEAVVKDADKKIGNMEKKKAAYEDDHQDWVNNVHIPNQEESVSHDDETGSDSSTDDDSDGPIKVEEGGTYDDDVSFDH
ncbi:hypothetical protein HOG17_03315 [Candidatus Peregrinibacteria bacterium]|jgi:hypothetical protein|nr:hypothetical protein [Candidatus Peregrinibacteria bacterium]MBT4148235.1 hypothetical protein [Candidatus Peregrinibacteria bacterium]MBT4455873.1 hypothetical protein [Candidatus Peregrinibacteria bacterium]